MTMTPQIHLAGRPIGAAFLAGMLAVFSVFAAWFLLKHQVHSDAMHATSVSRPATIVTPLSCEKLEDIPGKSVTTVSVVFPANAYTPAHRHPGSVTVYVVRGTVRSQLSGGPAVTYTAGGTWFEPPGALHLFAENASSTEPAEVLAIFIADENCGPLVIPEP
jgi:quercetin dioxygenase-like cupin family protein